VIPSIKGSAYVNAEATLILDPRDPFSMGIPR
jgi:proline racemase